MLKDITKDRYRALQLLADHIRTPSRELKLEAILKDISDEDLRWVTDKIHYYLLKLLQDIDFELVEDSIEDLKNSIISKQKEPCWKWGDFEGDIEKRSKLVAWVRHEMSFKSISEEIIREFISFYEEGLVESWVSKYKRESESGEKND